MREISIKEMQKIELDLLLIFDEICKKNSLRYYIDGGTLLGAMCYEGFIPWDDDIDLKMPRPDYEKLLTIANQFPDHVSLDIPSAEHCEYTMFKLIDNRTVLIENDGDNKKTTGVYIDILPMDGHPDDTEECKKHLSELQRLNSLFHSSLVHFKAMKTSNSFASRIKGNIYDVIYTPWKLYKKLTNMAKKYQYDRCTYVGLLVEGDAIRERFERKWLDESIELEFEGYMVPAPSEYKRHMEIFYGDHITKEEYYHNLPMIPSNHKHEVYWKE